MLCTIFGAIKSFLVRGTHRTIASRILGGFGSSAISEFVSRIFPNITSVEKTELTTFAHEIREAGEAIRFAPKDETFPAERIPTNPYLSEDDPVGERVRYDVEVIDINSGLSRRVVIRSPFPMSPQEIADTAFDSAEDVFRSSGVTVGNLSMIIGNVISSEKQF